MEAPPSFAQILETTCISPQGPKLMENQKFDIGVVPKKRFDWGSVPKPMRNQMAD